MTDSILNLVPIYGLPLLAVLIALSCLAIPLPSSVVLMTTGSFVGTGELIFLPVVATAVAAAIFGDQIGFQIGKSGGAPLINRFAKSDAKQALVKKAQRLTESRGGVGVFLTRWLFSPLGPYVNIIGGATGMSRLTFTIFASLGEITWVLIYVGLGYAFSSNVMQVAQFMSDASGFLAGGAIMVFLGWRLKKALSKAGKPAA